MRNYSFARVSTTAPGAEAHRPVFQTVACAASRLARHAPPFASPPRAIACSFCACESSPTTESPCTVDGRSSSPSRCAILLCRCKQVYRTLLGSEAGRRQPSSGASALSCAKETAHKIMQSPALTTAGTRLGMARWGSSFAAAHQRIEQRVSSKQGQLPSQAKKA